MGRKKVMILGATGMAGHVVYNYLSKMGCYDCIDVVYRKPFTHKSIFLDVTDEKNVYAVLEKEHPDVVVNCVGVLIKGSRENPANAIYINAYFPHSLKKVCDKIDAKLIHVSTDCVFSGKKGLYSAHDFRDADDVYGRSKALGEIVDDKNLTIRTSIIGPELKKEGEGLFHWFMQQHKCEGYATAIWGGITTFELAKFIDFAIKENLTGLVQVSNNKGISKLELIKIINDIWKRNVEIIPVNKNGTDKSILQSPELNYNVPDYRKMLQDMYAWMMEYDILYNGIYKI